MALLTGQGPIATGYSNTSNPISQTSPQPGSAPAAGITMRDQQGFVYILCDAVATVFADCPVQINEDNTCQPLATTGRGRVGIAMTTATSDFLIWVKVYGRHIMQIGGSGSSPSDAANGPTTLSTSAWTRFVLASSLTTPATATYTSETSTSGFFIRGMSVASDASLDVSAVTSGNGAGGPTALTSTHTGNQIGVFLNYPIIQYDEGTSV